MIKRTLIGGGVTLLAMGLFFGRNAANFATTSVGWVRSTIDENVPVELKIEQVRNMIKQMEPEVRRNRHLIVREEVELERLGEQIIKLEAKQATEDAKLARMNAEVTRGERYVSFSKSGRRYPVENVKRDMARRLKRLQTNDETIVHLRDQLDRRQERLAAARVEVEQMLSARNQLVAEVENLEARQKMTSVAQTSSEFDIDTSTLARANQLIRDVETRLDVTERMLDVDVQYIEHIQVDEPETEDISAKVADYLRERNHEASVESIAAEITVESQL